VLQLVGWFIAPLVILLTKLLTKRESKIVSFHAFEALLPADCVHHFLDVDMASRPDQENGPAYPVLGTVAGKMLEDRATSTDGHLMSWLGIRFAFRIQFLAHCA